MTLLAVNAVADNPVFHGKVAHCYFNEGALTWRIGNDAIDRTVHFDRETGGLRTLEVNPGKLGVKLATVSPSEGEFTVLEGGGKAGPKTLRLDHDWAYMWQTVGTPAHGGRLVTIHLQGIRSNDGYEVEALYEAFPGDRPYLSKSLTLINRMKAPVTVTETLYDRWAFSTNPHTVKKKLKKGEQPPSPMPVKYVAGKDGFSEIIDGDNQASVVATVLGTGGETDYENGALIQRFRGPATVKPDGGRFYGPRVLTFVYTGQSSVGIDLMNAFRQSYLSSKP